MKILSLNFPRIFSIMLMVAAPLAAHAQEVALPEPTNRPLEMDEALETLQKNVTAADVRIACSEYGRPDFLNRERMARRAMCNGFFFGVASTVAILRRDRRIRPRYCFPASLSTEDIIEMFMLWSENKRGLNAYLASEGVLRALDEAYPCTAGN